VDLKLSDNVNTKKKNESLSTSKEVPNIDFSIRSKAAEWGEEDDHIQYLIENRKK
jgi:hypothetical protein